MLPRFAFSDALRSSLVAPGREPLHTEVEVDEAYVGGKEVGGKRGRGSEKKALVVVAVELIRWVAPDPQHPGDPNAGVEKVRAGRVRLTVLPDASADTLVPWVRQNVEKGATVWTDGWPSYNGLAASGYCHEVVKQTVEGRKTGRHLPMVHRIISNLKRWLLGTHHGRVEPKHLQAYLNEYTFRFNRRFWRGPAFLRALSLVTHAETWPEYVTLYSAGDDGGWSHPAAPR